MTWLQPWAAGFLAVLPVIVLLYLLKVRRRPMNVSTLMFWRQVVQENRRRALFQRLRHVLSMLLHLLIAALIVGALARPTLDLLARDGSAVVVVLDRRARMNAREADGETRFTKAVREALALVADASVSRQFCLLTVGPEPETLVPFTGSERLLRATLTGLTSTDAGGNLADALDHAEQLLATRQGHRQIVLLTDRPSDPALAARHPQLLTRAVGSSAGNRAILRFAARPLPASPSTSEILLEIANFSDATLSTELELRYDDRLIDVKPLELTAGGRRTMIFPSVPRPSRHAKGELTARLASDDALPGDNLARLWLPPPTTVRGLLVSRGNIFIEKALAADPTISYEIVTPESWTQDLTGRFDVSVFDAFVPPTPIGGCAFYLQRSPFDRADPPLDSPPISEVDPAHPTTRGLDFSQTTLRRSQAMAVPSGDEWRYQTPLRSLEEVLLLVGEKTQAPNQRVAALGIDLSTTDLPLRIAFPLLITNTIHWLAGVSLEAPQAATAGELIALPAGARIVGAPEAVHSYRPMLNGFYSLERAGRTERLAVNTFDEAESDLRFTSPTQGAASGVRTSGFYRALPVWPLWRYLAFAALALFTLEWSLFHRRRTE